MTVLGNNSITANFLGAAKMGIIIVVWIVAPRSLTLGLVINRVFGGSNCVQCAHIQP